MGCNSSKAATEAVPVQPADREVKNDADRESEKETAAKPNPPSEAFNDVSSRGAFSDSSSEALSAHHPRKTSLLGQVSSTAIKGAQTVGTTAIKGAQTVSTTAIKGAQTVSTTAIKGAQTVGSPIVRGAHHVGTTTVKGVQTVGTTAILHAKTVGEVAYKGARKGVDETFKRLSAVGNAFLDPSIALELLRPIGDKVNTGAHHVKNIFAKPLQDLLSVAHYKPPTHPKTDEEREVITNGLNHNFVFETLSPKELKPLVDAFEKINVSAEHVVIKQGDDGDYFYIVLEGECEFLIDDHSVGKAGPGASFGELALLYTCPRAATVKAVIDTVLFRVDQTCFRFILKKLMEKSQQEKEDLLASVNFLKDLGVQERSKLSRVMTPIRFNAGDYLMHKGDVGDNFYILMEGIVKATDIGVGTSQYEDIILQKPGDYFGERALVTGEPRSANVIAVTDGLAFKIDKKTFETVLGSFTHLVTRAQYLQSLSSVKVIKDSELDSQTLSTLSKLITEQKFKKGDTIMLEGKSVAAALYFVQEGKIELTWSKEGSQADIKACGTFFGEEQLLTDVKDGKMRPARAIAEYSAIAVEDSTLGVLALEKCRKVVDTKYLGKPPPSVRDSLLDRNIKDQELKRHRILGAGTFGQVWLVSRSNAVGQKVPYALKVQSKYELICDGQAKAVVYEKKIMATLNHPFLISLVNSYQDEHFVYMVMEVIQGGELYNVIHTDTRDFLPEKDARFYAAGIAEGLGYMHQRGYVYRDLKPENVLINNRGYAVIIDFGFAKYVTDKTFTLCGTPLYLAPEVILNRGHNWGADHWSLGVLTYEMLTGKTPFYMEGMNQMDLFRAIVKGIFTLPPEGTSSLACDIIRGFLTRNPSQRLGSLAGGEDDVFSHQWFEDLDFVKLRNQELEPPFLPTIKDLLDASHFEDWSHLEDKTHKKFPRLTREQAAIFADF